MTASNPVMPATKPVATKTSKTNAKTTKKTTKTNAVKTAAAKSAKHILSHAQRSEISRIAAFKAHNHPTFMKLHARAAKNADMTPAAYIREMKQARPAKYRKI